MTIRIEFDVYDRDNEDIEAVEQDVLDALRSSGMCNITRVSVVLRPAKVLLEELENSFSSRILSREAAYEMLFMESPNTEND